MLLQWACLLRVYWCNPHFPSGKPEGLLKTQKKSFKQSYFTSYWDKKLSYPTTANIVVLCFGESNSLRTWGFFLLLTCAISAAFQQICLHWILLVVPCFGPPGTPLLGTWPCAPRTCWIWKGQHPHGNSTPLPSQHLPFPAVVSQPAVPTATCHWTIKGCTL